MFHSKNTHVHPKPDREPLHSPFLPSMSTWTQEQKVLLRWSIGTMLLALLVIGSVLALLLPSVHAVGATNPHQDCHVKVHLVQWPGFINPVTETVSENGHQVQLGVALMFSDTCQMNFAEATIGAPPTTRISQTSRLNGELDPTAAICGKTIHLELAQHRYPLILRTSIRLLVLMQPVCP